MDDEYYGPAPTTITVVSAGPPETPTLFGPNGEALAKVPAKIGFQYNVKRKER